MALDAGPFNEDQDARISIALANGIILLGQTLRYRSLFVAGLRLDPGDGILPCTTVTELIDCVQSLCLLFVREWSRPGQGFLTETLNRAAASEFVWTSAAKDALLCGSAG